MAFVVAGQAAVRGQPGQSAFHRPTAGQHLKPFLACGFSDDLDDDVQHRLRPFDEAAGETGVGEHEPAAARGQEQPQQCALGAVAVLHARSAHGHSDRQAQGAGHDELDFRCF